MNWLQDILSLTQEQNLLRVPLTLRPQSPTQAYLDNRLVTVFCSNDYLGLRFDSRLLQAATNAAKQDGAGSGASRLVSGNTPSHDEAEKALAELVELPAALLANSGFAANVGALASLVGPEDVIFSDALNHASIIDGCRLSRARVVIYPHADAEALSRQIQHHRPFRRGWIVTESIFSMDGDLAPLVQLRALCDRECLHLYVDEAHALGTIGDRGQGAAAHVRIQPDVLVGPLGKATGAAGAFIAGSDALRLFLWNRSRSFVFSTGLAPATAAAAGVAARIIRNEPNLGSRLRANVKHLRNALHQLQLPIKGHHDSPIIPLMVGDERRALALSQRILDQGFFVQAIRPPTVPAGTARLRITVSAAHTHEQIDALVRSLAQNI